MQCPQCERRLPPDRNRCMYCGAAADTGAGAALPSAPDDRRSGSAHVPDAENSSPGLGLKKSLQADLDKLPPVFRAEVEKALRAGPEPRADRPAMDADSLSSAIGTARQSLQSLKQGFDTDRIDYDEYRELVLQTLRPLVERLDKKAGLEFVLKQLKSSDLGVYVDDAIYRSLCRQVLAVAAGPVKKESPWHFGLFRKKRK